MLPIRKFKFVFAMFCVSKPCTGSPTPTWNPGKTLILEAKHQGLEITLEFTNFSPGISAKNLEITLILQIIFENP